jgi:hypothetical protein
MPLKQRVKGSLAFRRTLKSILPIHGFNTAEGWLPVTLDLIEKLEELAKSRWTTDEHRDIVKGALTAIDLTRARAREIIMNCKSNTEIMWDIERAKRFISFHD